MSTAVDDGFEALLEHIRVTRGFDFTGYKRTSLRRRVEKRLEVVGCQDPGCYLDYLEVHPDEFPLLFNTVLINVTSFFRDPPAWDYLRQTAIPEMLGARSHEGPIRVWCAGCASGEEAYSLAMVLAEAVGEENFRDRVKIYATDVDDDALTEARQGTYPLTARDAIPEDLAERFLERTDSRFTFRRDLRRSVIFGRNDLVRDAPISRLDLLSCRNTLMYFNAETQTEILNRMHYALCDTGILFLGKAEMLVTRSTLFTPVEPKCRVFRPDITAPRRRVLTPVPELPTGGADRDSTLAGRTVRELAWDLEAVAQVVVDAAGQLAGANRAARELFGLALSDVGRPLQDLELSYRPVELRSAIQQARSNGEPLVFEDVRWPRLRGGEGRLEIRVSPLGSDGEAGAVAVTFQDNTERRRLQDELESSRRDLEVAYEELQSTVEELETTNEELQSTNEELETTNEELQSTNEELETMNEELQSTNEELETLNNELQERSSEVTHVNRFLENILNSLGVGVIAVDREGVVTAWSDRAEEQWGLRLDEAVGRHLLSLEMGLPPERLAASLRGILSGEEERVETEVEAVDRRGRAVRGRVITVPIADGAGAAPGAIFLVEASSA